MKEPQMNPMDIGCLACVACVGCVFCGTGALALGGAGIASVNFLSQILTDINKEFRK